MSFPEVGGEFRTAQISLLSISYRGAPPRFVVGDIFPSYLAAEPGSSLRHRRSQDRVRGERRGRLVEQVRLRRGPSSGINGRRGATGKDQGRESERKGGRKREREKEKQREEGRSSAEE